MFEPPDVGCYFRYDIFMGWWGWRGAGWAALSGLEKLACFDPGRCPGLCGGVHLWCWKAAPL